MMKIIGRITPLRLALLVVALFAVIFAVSLVPQRVRHQLDAFEYRISDPSDHRPTKVTIDGWLQTPLFLSWNFRGKVLVEGYEQLAKAGDTMMNAYIQLDSYWPGKYDGSVTYTGYAEDFRPMGYSLGFIRMQKRMKEVYIGINEPVAGGQASFDGSSGLVVLAPATTLEEAQRLHDRLFDAKD